MVLLLLLRDRRKAGARKGYKRDGMERKRRKKKKGRRKADSRCLSHDICYLVSHDNI